MCFDDNAITLKKRENSIYFQKYKNCLSCNKKECPDILDCLSIVINKHVASVVQS